MKHTVITTPDGNVRHRYEAEEGETNLLFTGPATGTLTVADGTPYDVTPHWIAVADDHHAELNHLIAVQHEETGRLDSVDPVTGEPIRFRHVDCPHTECDR